MVVVIIISLLSYNLFLKQAPKAKASTIVSSYTQSSGNSAQRHVVVTSKGTIVAFYMSTGQDLVYSISTDNGSTWGSANTVATVIVNDFSVVIDGSDNIYATFSTNCSGACSSVFIVKLTNTGTTTWSVGTVQAVATGGACQSTIVDGDSYSLPTIAITSSGKVWVNYLHTFYDLTINCAVGNNTMTTASSTNLTSWTLNSNNIPSCTNTAPIVASGTSIWAYCANNLYADISGSGLWTNLASWAVKGGVSASVVYGLDQLHFFYDNNAGLAYRSYDLSTNTLSSETTISSSTNDVLGTLVTDSQNLWAIYSSYVGSNSYNVVYKRFNGTSWDVSSTALTTDNLNNIAINAPGRVPNTANVPVIWSSGTTNPYTINGATFSTTGSVTDTGNQTGSLTGSLTGSGGDVIVKCGVWYYNTVNIASGMTIKVCSNNGQTGGSLEIHANSVIVAGTIDGTGRGMPGGASAIAFGGAGGTGGLTPSPATNGQNGTSQAGANGAGSFNGSGGSGPASNGVGSTSPGTNATAAGSNANTLGGTGGGGGTSSSSNGGSGANGGYKGVATNGDSSTDETLNQGSGGGSGGSGGSGGGGAGGGGGNMSSGQTACPGIGGNGAAGAAGGAGGKGGNGGANVKIYSTGSLSVTGSILATGTAGVTGGSGSSGASGVNGSTGGFIVCGS